MRTNQTAKRGEDKRGEAMGAERKRNRKISQRERGGKVEAGAVRFIIEAPRLPAPHPLCNSFNSPLSSVIFNSLSH